jgi:glycosyltransferase involved in cell wall biosynthesis
VIPTYRHRDFLLQSIESVHSQTFNDCEIIVVNDGSPDDTAAILQPMVKAGTIRYVEQPNQGQATARNRGLAMAKGQFVAFLDDDDLWPPDKLEWQVRLLDQNPQLSAVAGGLLFIDEKGGELDRFPLSAGAVTFESLFDGNPFFSPGQTLIRTDRLRAIGGFDPSMSAADDYDVWFRLAKTGGIEAIDRVSLLYRQHPLNASKNAARMFYQTLGVIKKQLDEAPAEVRKSARVRVHRFLYSYAFRNLLNVSKKQIRKREWSGLFALPGPTAHILKRALRDPRILLWLILDLLPHRRLVSLLSRRRTSRTALEAIKRSYLE